MLQSMVLQRVRYYWATELNWTEHSIQCLLFLHETVILTSWFSLSYGKRNSRSFLPYFTGHSFALSHLLCGLPWCLSVKESAYLMQETWVQSLVWKDPQEKEIAIQSSILACKSHGQRSLSCYSLWGRKELDITQQLNSSNLLCIPC